MGFLDKLKGAVNAVTGGAAKVTMEYQPQMGFPGQMVQVRITATSTGAEVKSKGIFVDLRAVEHIYIKGGTVVGVSTEVRASVPTFEQAIQIAPEFVLPPGQTMTFDGAIQIPPGVQPSYEGPHAEHAWEIRGRVEAFGNDPDTGFLPFAVGLAG